MQHMLSINRIDLGHYFNIVGRVKGVYVIYIHGLKVILRCFKFENARPINSNISMHESPRITVSLNKKINK